MRRFAQQAMACTFEILLVEPDADYAARAAEAAFAELGRLEAELSRFVPTSDVSRIGRLAARQSVRVAPETLGCLRLALRLYVQTGGAFDVCYGSAKAAGRRFPLALESARCAVRALADGVRVDLGGIGKGYAVDRLVGLLREWSIAAALVHAGQSTVFALGSPPGESAWSVALRHPLKQQQELGRLRLRDAALSGSGRLLHGGHVVDPRGRRPPEAQPAGAWAVAPSAAWADALSTAFMVMPPADVAAYCRQHPEAAALLCSAGSAGTLFRSFGRLPMAAFANGQ